MQISQRYKELFANTGIMALSQFSSKILVFLLVPLYTSVLTTEEYGIFDLIVSTVQLCIPILTVNAAEGIMRFLMDKKNNPSEVISIGLKFACNAILVAAVFLSANRVFCMIPAIYKMELLIFLFFTFFLLQDFFLQCAKGVEQVRVMGVAGILGTICMVSFNILFLLVFHWGLQGFFLANILAQFIPVIYYIIKLHPYFKIQLSTSKSLRKALVLYSIPLIANALAWRINSAADKYVVTLMVGATANGLLAVAYKIPAIINTIENIFIQAWQISAVKEYDGKNSDKFYSDVLIYLSAFSCVLCSLMIIFIRVIAGILFAKDFAGAWCYVPFLLVSSLINAASGILGPILGAKMDSKAIGRAGVAGAIVNIILNIVLVKFWGVQGAVIATVVSSYVIYAVRYTAVKDSVEIKHHARILLSWGMLCVQAALSIYFQCYIGQALVLGALVAIYWKPALSHLLLIIRKFLPAK